MNFSEFIALLSNDKSGSVFNPYASSKPRYEGEMPYTSFAFDPTVTPRQLIEPYYGNQYNNEVLKAKQYNEDNPQTKVDLGRLEQPVQVSTSTGDKPQTVFGSMTGTSETAGLLPTAYMASPEQVARALWDGETVGKPGNEQFNFKPNRPINTQVQPDNFEDAYMKYAEHMIGQNVTRRALPDSNTIHAGDYSPQSFDDVHSEEMGSNLGMLTREHFKKTGARLDKTSAMELIQQPDSWNQYSDYAQRALRVLRQAAENSPALIERYLGILPGLVSNENPTAKSLFA